MTDLPHPWEGIVGVACNEDDLLSLDKKALPRRMMMANLAHVIQSATLVGNPAPVVNRIYERISNPQVGDLVIETSTFYRGSIPQAFGILRARRDEWDKTDEEYAKDYAENLNGEQDGWRGIDHNVHYIQFGPHPDNVYRWHNCSFITIPTEDRFAQKLFGNPFDRGSILGALGDSGFELNTESVLRDA